MIYEKILLQIILNVIIEYDLWEDIIIYDKLYCIVELYLRMLIIK